MTSTKPKFDELDDVKCLQRQIKRLDGNFDMQKGLYPHTLDILSNSVITRSFYNREVFYI